MWRITSSNCIEMSTISIPLSLAASLCRRRKQQIWKPAKALQWHSAAGYHIKKHLASQRAHLKSVWASAVSRPSAKTKKWQYINIYIVLWEVCQLLELLLHLSCQSTSAFNMPEYIRSFYAKPQIKEHNCFMAKCQFNEWRLDETFISKGSSFAEFAKNRHSW